MRFNFYRSTCNAVLALVSLFAFGFIDGQRKTVQSADKLLTAKKPGSKAQDSFVWIPAPYCMMGRNQ